MMLKEILIVGFGGFIGTILRYIITILPIQESSTFPWNTFIVNIIGVILISIISFYITKNVNYDENIILFLKVGLCGGFTTFSTFALETGDLIRQGNTTIALIYVLLSVVISVLIIFAPDILIESYN